MSNKLRKINWRTARGTSSRDDILDVAGQIMSSHGYEGTSIAVLSKATGLNVSSIYWHFGSKAGLLAALMERGAQRLLGDLESVLVAAPGHREFLRMLIVLLVTHGDSVSHAVVQRVRAQGRDSVRRQIEIAFSAGQTAAQAAHVAEQLADYAIALIEGAFLAKEANPSLPFENLMLQLADALALLGAAALPAARLTAH